MTSVGEAFICQETFLANNATSCLRYTKLKHCVKDGQEMRGNFLCVGANTISVGGSVQPLPANLTLTPFMCTMDSCPTQAPEKEKKKDKSNSTGSSVVSEKTMTLSGALVLALVLSQMMMF
ncbi:hypothetical protein BGZ83_008771 [Gryganskiella cystojenkinii]|nr:hypothetical protein BGZ83_008771 [Gryganskiella cystojenkinii]